MSLPANPEEAAGAFIGDTLVVLHNAAQALDHRPQSVYRVPGPCSKFWKCLLQVSAVKPLKMSMLGVQM